MRGELVAIGTILVVVTSGVMLAIAPPLELILFSAAVVGVGLIHMGWENDNG